MARIEISGFSETVLSMEEIANIPDSVIADMLNAQADVVIKAQERVGRRMGVYRTGQTLSSLKKGKVTRNAITISFAGKNKDGNRNAEVAFINEHGKKGQPARPFIRTANEEAASKAEEAGAKVLQDWQNSK